MIKNLNPIDVMRVLKEAGFINDIAIDKYVITGAGDKWVTRISTLSSQIIISPNGFKDIKISLILTVTDAETAMAILCVDKIEGHITITIREDGSVILLYNFLVDLEIDDIDESVEQAKKDIEALKEAMSFITVNMEEMDREDDGEDEGELLTTEDQILGIELE